MNIIGKREVAEVHPDSNEYRAVIWTETFYDTQDFPSRSVYDIIDASIELKLALDIIKHQHGDIEITYKYNDSEE